jgi:hypothetical protein
VLTTQPGDSVRIDDEREDVLALIEHMAEASSSVQTRRGQRLLISVYPHWIYLVVPEHEYTLA